MAQEQGDQPQFVRCLRNDGYSASLELLKVYQVLTDPDAASHGMLRVVDESDEDYLYPAQWFVAVPAPGLKLHGERTVD